MLTDLIPLIYNGGRIIMTVSGIYIAAVCFRNYKMTHIYDYTIFGWFFALAALHTGIALLGLVVPGITYEMFLITKASNDLLHNILSFVAAMSLNFSYYFLITVWRNSLRQNIARYITSMANILLVVIFMINLPIVFGQDFFITSSFGAIVLVRYWFSIPFVILLILTFLSIYNKMRGVESNATHFRSVRFLWNVTLICGSLGSMMVVADLLILQATFIVNGILTPGLTEIFLSSYLLLGIAFISLAIIALRYPAGLLVFDYQLTNAIRSIRTIGGLDVETPVNDGSTASQIYDYLDAINQSDLFRKAEDR